MQLRSTGLLAALLVIVLVGGAGTAQGQSIGLNFVNNSTGGIQNGNAESLGAAESAGAPGYEQVNWNNLGRWGAGTALLDSTGAAAGVTATWDSNNTWNSGSGTTTPNRKLMYGYIDATGQVNDNSTPYLFWDNKNKPEIYIKGLSAWMTAVGAINYTVVVYSDGDATEGRRSEYWLQGIDGTNTADPPTVLGADLTSHVFLIDNANFAGTFTQVPLSANSLGNAAAGNFMVFTDLTADSFVLRTEEQTFRAQINGVQIIAVKYLPPTVTIAAAQSAAEPATPGTFTVTRSGGTTSVPTEVFYAVSGTATNGADYQTLSGSVIIPANETQATITVNPIDDGTVENDETVILTLTTAPTYLVGTPDNAQITLTSDDSAATITVAATDATSTEVAGDTGHFTLTRTGPALFSLTVKYTLSGTATNGGDYAYLSGTAVIPDGESTVVIPVVPFEDGTTEGIETVTLTLAPSDVLPEQYVAGAANSADVTIADNGAWSHWTQSLNLYFAGYLGSEALTDFPVLVVLTPDRVGNYAGFAANGADIRFKAGNVSLPYEIEQWNPAGASYIWVKVPQIAAATDFITLVWNNPTAVDAQGPNVVWSGDYVGVWHFSAFGPDGKYLNSTMTGSDGTNFGATPVQGWLGGALNFDATLNAYVDTGNTEQITTWTVLTWVRSPAAPDDTNQSGPVHREANYQINWNHSDANFRAGAGMATALGWYGATMNPLSADTWYLLAGTYDQDTLSSYRNGTLVTANTDPVGEPALETNSLKFGRHAASAQYFNGVIDEVQVLRAARSAGWIANQYASMNDDLIAYGGVVAQVQIVANQPNAAEPATNGEITITRSGGALGLPLTVYYQISGTATPDMDYVALPATVTFAAGQTQAVLPVAVIKDSLPLEGNETVVVTLTNRANYDILAGTATVTITDEDTLANWGKQKRIGFGGYHGTTAVQNLPVLVTLTPATTDNYAGFAANGADIRFLDAARTTVLTYEIERWDPAGTSLLWVRVPSIASAQDCIWMYWNNPGALPAQNPAAVWTESFLAVYHFGDAATILDSTANHYDGTNTNSTSETGALGLGRGFNGTDAYVDLGSSFMNNLGAFTISGWISPQAASFADRVSLFGQNDLIEYGWSAGPNLQAWVSAGGTWPGLATAYTYAPGEWHYIVFVGNATSLLQYVDGVLVNSRTDLSVTNQGTSGDTAKIGGGVIDTVDVAGGWYNGLMDEVRFAATDRSADWIAAEYAAMTGTLTRCGTPTVDVDQDGDVDQVDFAVFQRCFTGAGVEQTNPECSCVETTGDRYITAEDLVGFMKCLSGPMVKADPDCLTAAATR